MLRSTVAYHDEEWGRPSRDETHLFELLTLEAFQSGLSWLTILRKREGFRAAFDALGRGPRGRLRRPRRRAAARRRGHRPPPRQGRGDARKRPRRARPARDGLTLAQVLWDFAPEPGPPPGSRADLAASTPESAALSKELRRRGFRFVGPTVAYSLMQAAGLVNDHLAGCELR